MKKMIPWLALIVTLLILGTIAAQIDDWGRDWTTNYAELSEEAEHPDLRPLTLEMDLDAAQALILDWVQSQSHWDVLDDETADSEQSDPAAGTLLRLTRSTKLFRFVDDITVRLTAVDGGKVSLHAESQSRLGKGDLGQNPRNLKELTQGIGRLAENGPADEASNAPSS